MAGDDEDRPYQRWCTHQSQLGNVIVVLPTGTGKTRVAVRAIQAASQELRRQCADACSPSTRLLPAVFLAPTESLCLQQADVLSRAGLRVACMCAGMMSTLALKRRRHRQEQDGTREHQNPRGRSTGSAPSGSRRSSNSSNSSSNRSSSLDIVESNSDEEAAPFDSSCAAARVPEQQNHTQDEAMSLATMIGTWTTGDGCPTTCEGAPVADTGPSDAERAQLQQQQQQQNEGASSTKLPICGRMEASSKRCWSALLSGFYDVLVATPAELVAGLVHAFIKVPDAALWVFDEAHHTTGDHAYAMLTRFLASVEVHRQPRILGLTATPPVSWSQRVDSMAKNVLALEESFGASLVTAPNNDHEALLPTVLEEPLAFAPFQPPEALAEALETLQISQKALKDVAEHKQKRQLLATQAHLERAAAVAGQSRSLGAGMVLDESLTNSYHTMAAQMSAAIDCCHKLGLWGCVACLRHGLLSKVDAKVFSYALEDTDEQEGFHRPWYKRRQGESKSSNGGSKQRSSARSDQGGSKGLYSGSNPALMETEQERKNLEAKLQSTVGADGCSSCSSFRELEDAAARRALSNALLALCEAAAPDDTDLYCELAAGIDSVFDRHGVLSSVQDGHLADAVATRILLLMPPSHMVQLLLPQVTDTMHETSNTESDYNPWADASTMDSTSGWFSTKFKALMPLLVSGQPLGHAPIGSASPAAGPPGWRGSAMVFAERKAAVLVMHELMCTLPAYAKNGVKSAPFVGDTIGFASANPPSRMSLNTQRRVMSNFHSGELNMLFATRVGAEGLDFGCCGLVCLFDLPNHVQEYLQCRGRGRLQASMCMRLMEEGHAASRRKFEDLVGDAVKLRSAIAARHKAYMDGGRLSSPGFPIPLEDDGGFTLPATCSHCPPSCAKDILESFCNSLPGNTEYMQLRPRYATSNKGGGYYSAILFMPSNSPVLIEKSGECLKGKPAAKRACALAAVRKLHSLQAIDDHLCPVGLALPQDGKPENAALAEKIMHRDMVGTIARVDLEHNLAQVLLPLSHHRHPQPHHKETAPHQSCPQSKGYPEASTGAERAVAAAAASELRLAAAVLPHAPKQHRIMQLYGFVLQRTPLPAPQFMGPLGIPIYDDAGDGFYREHCSSREGVGCCPWPSPPQAPPQEPGCAPASHNPMDLDEEDIQANACCKSTEGGKLCASDSSSSSSSSSWLHPFGILVHNILPASALPPFSIWLRDGSHALAAAVHLGPVPCSPADAAACVIGHAVLGGQSTRTSRGPDTPAPSVEAAARAWGQASGITQLRAALQAAGRAPSSSADRSAHMSSNTHTVAGTFAHAPPPAADASVSATAADAPAQPPCAVAVPALEDAAAELNRHWCLIVPVAQHTSPASLPSQQPHHHHHHFPPEQLQQQQHQQQPRISIPVTTHSNGPAGPQALASLRGGIDWAMYAHLCEGATPLSALVDMGAHALRCSATPSPPVPQDHHHAQSQHLPDNQHQQYQQLQQQQETKHGDADAGIPPSWLERLERTLHGRVVMLAFNSNQRFVWQGAARVVPQLQQDQEQKLEHTPHNDQYQKQQQQERSHGAQAHAYGAGAARSAAEMHLLTLDNAAVVDWGMQGTSYRQLFKRFYPHLCLDSLPSNTPLVLGEVGVRHCTRGNVLLPPTTKWRTSQKADAPSGNAATAGKQQGTGRTAAAAAAAAEGCAAGPCELENAGLAGTAHLDPSQSSKLEPSQPKKSSSGHHSLLCVPKHMLPKSLPPQPSGPSPQLHPPLCPDKAPGTAGSSPCQVLLPGALLLHPLPLHEWQACAMTPSLVWRLEGLLAAHELRERMRALLLQPPTIHLSAPSASAAAAAGAAPATHGPSYSTQPCSSAATHNPSPLPTFTPGAIQAALPSQRDVLAALSSTSAGEAFSCEAAELMGDAVLDYLAVLHLFDTLPACHEGVLSECKVRLVANEVLLDVATGACSTSSSSSSSSSNKRAKHTHDHTPGSAGPVPQPAHQQGMAPQLATAMPEQATPSPPLLREAQAGAQGSAAPKGTEQQQQQQQQQQFVGQQIWDNRGREGEQCLMLHRYVRARPLNPQHVWGAGSRVDDPSRVLKAAKGKRVADSVEALIGATFLASGGAAALGLNRATGWEASGLTHGLASAALLCERMGIMPAGSSRNLQALLLTAGTSHGSPPCKPPSTTHTDSAPGPSSRLHSFVSGLPHTKSKADTDLMAELEPLLGGYTFTNHLLLWEALTHCSFPHPPCNQRLEFLGDSALKMAVTVHLFEHCNRVHAGAGQQPVNPQLHKLGSSSLQPRFMHYARMRLVNNQTLSLICARSGLHKFLRTGLKNVSSLATSWAHCVEEADAQACLAGGAGAQGPGDRIIAQAAHQSASHLAQRDADVLAAPTEVEGTSGNPGTANTGLSADGNIPAAPKLLADLLEAVLGAVMLDCDAGGGRGLAAVWQVFCGLAHTAQMGHLLA